MKFIFDILISLFLPVLLVIRLIMEIYQKSKYLVVFFPILLSSFFFYFQPKEYFDLYYHYMAYDSYQNGGSLYQISGYFGLKYLTELFVYFNFPKNSLLYFTTFVISSCMYYILYLSSIKFDKKLRQWMFFLLILFVPWLSILSGIRFGLAIFTFFLIVYISENNKKNIILFLIPLSFHYAILFPICIYLLSLFFNVNRFSYRILLVFLIISFFIGVNTSQIVISVVKILGLENFASISSYIGDKNVGSVSSLSSNVKILYYMQRFTFISMVLFFVRYSDFKYHYNNFLYLISVFILLFINFPILSGRLMFPSLIAIILFNGYLFFYKKNKYIVYSIFVYVAFNLLHFLGFYKHYINNFIDYISNYPILHLLDFL